MSQVVAEFNKAYPLKTPSDVLYFDTFIRLPMLKIMSHKADQNGAPVYGYVFSFGSPLAIHTAEIPLVFNNPDKESPIALGTEKTQDDIQANAQMADIMSSAWISFAKTGTPAAPSLPAWEPYNRNNGATMILDLNSTLVYRHDWQLIKQLAPQYQW